MANIQKIKSDNNTAIRAKTVAGSITTDNVTDRIDAVADAITDVLGGLTERYDLVEVENAGFYDGFPTVALRGSDLYAMFKRGADHLTPATVLPIKKSTNGGVTWGTTATISTDTYEQFAFGTTSTGRLVAITSNGGNTFNLYRTGLYDDVWVDLGTMTDPYPAGESCVYGKIKELPSGRLLCPFYRYDVGNLKAGFLSSTDDGASWAYYNDVAANLNEIGWEIISGTTDADTILMAVVRQDSGTNSDPNKLYTSTNGGVTWGFIANVPFTRNILYGFPGDIYKDGNDIWVVFGSRYTGAYSLAPMCVTLWKFDVANYATVASWGTEKTFYMSESGNKGASNDWGYPSVYKWGNDIYSLFYEADPRAVAVATTVDTRIIGLRLTDRHEALFFTTIVGTFEDYVYSKVQMVPVLDTGFSSIISTVYFVIIPSDGDYYIRAKATFSNSNVTGAYRQFGAVLFDMGYPVDPVTQYPKNPINAAVAPEGVHLITSITRAPANDTQVLTFEFSANFRALKGRELVIYGKHPVTGVQINLSNIELYIKRI